MSDCKFKQCLTYKKSFNQFILSINKFYQLFKKSLGIILLIKTCIIESYKEITKAKNLIKN